jgi:hypothetical protein
MKAIRIYKNLYLQVSALCFKQSICYLLPILEVYISNDHFLTVSISMLSGTAEIDFTMFRYSKVEYAHKIRREKQEKRKS